MEGLRLMRLTVTTCVNPAQSNALWDQFMDWSNLCFSFLKDLASEVALGRFKTILNHCLKLLRDSTLFPTMAKFLALQEIKQIKET